MFQSLCYFILLISGSALKFNTNYERRSWKKDHKDGVQRTDPTECDNTVEDDGTAAECGTTAVSYGGGGCHSMIAQQGYSRGFRFALSAPTDSEGNNQVLYRHQAYQVTSSGGGWFWGALLGYKKSFNPSTDELYGMDQEGWLALVVFPNLDLDEAACALAAFGEMPGCAEFRAQQYAEHFGSGYYYGSGMSGNGGGSGVRDRFFFRQSLLEQTSNQQTQARAGWSGSASCFATDVDDGVCPFEFMIAFFGPCQVCAKQKGHVAAVALSNRDHVYKNILEPTGMPRNVIFEWFEEVETGLDFYWYVAWAIYKYNDTSVNTDGEASYSSAGERVHDMEGSGWHGTTLVLDALSTSSNFLAALVCGVATFSNSGHLDDCPGFNMAQMLETADSTYFSLLNIFDTIPMNINFGANPGTSYSAFGEFQTNYDSAKASDAYPVDSVIDPGGVLPLLKLMEVDDDNAATLASLDGDNQIFPVVLQTGVAFTMGQLQKSAWWAVIMYFSETIENESRPEFQQLSAYFCTDNWLTTSVANGNWALSFADDDKMWGDNSQGCDADPNRWLFRPPDDAENCDNFFSKVRQVGLIYVESVTVLENDLFFIAGGWDFAAFAVSIQIKSDLSSTWLYTTDPVAAAMAGCEVQSRSYGAPSTCSDGVDNNGDKDGDGDSTTMFFRELEGNSGGGSDGSKGVLLQKAGKVKTWPEELDNPDHFLVSAGSGDVGEEEVGTDSFEGLSARSYMLLQFPSFPVLTMQYLPVKLAYLLNNYMSHLSYTQQCCLLVSSDSDYYESDLFGGICPFCRDNYVAWDDSDDVDSSTNEQAQAASLCPCYRVVNEDEAGTPAQSFTFPVLS